MKPIGLALGLLALAGCASPRGAMDRQPPFEIERTSFPGSLWNKAHARASVVSQDGGQSFPVPGGALWTFGDTFKGSRSADGKPHFAGGGVSCSIAFLSQSARAWPPAFRYYVSQDGAVTSPLEYLPSEKPVENYRLWPMGGIHRNGRYYLYYSVIEVFGPGSWDFRPVGTGLAAGKRALGPYQRLLPQERWQFPVDPTQVLEADGWLYLFGIQKFGSRFGVTLARVRPEKIEDPDAYEFYAGPGPKFSARKKSAACLVPNAPGQVSVAWNSYLQKYVMASSSDLFGPREIRLMVADSPAGPWSAPMARVLVPETRQGKQVQLVYCAYLHPELFKENGRVMNLTYSLILKDSGFDANCEMAEVEIRRPD